MTSERYKWIALSNVTLGVLLATLDGSIVLIAMPDIFRGIRLDPLRPDNSFYLLWMILGYLVVTSVLVVGFGRLGDLFGRVRMYTLGFAVYTLASLLLTIGWMHGSAGADWLIAFRLVQGIGAAFLIGNSAAILTDAFPSHQRGLALGLTNVVGISGQFIGLLLGGLLAPVNWRFIFLVSVPFGLIGTVWSHMRLRELGIRTRAPIDVLGNATFALGLVLVMIAVTYGIRPYRDSSMGWSSPLVISCIATGLALLVSFVFVERHQSHPMFRLQLFRIRAYTCGVLASFLSSIARGGLMFMLIIWLQGIWLPEHGYAFSRTPLWAGIYMLPLTIGFLTAGPVAGVLSDRFGARLFATGGMLGAAVSFGVLDALPVNFAYWPFAGALLLMGLATGAFSSPNRAGVMNSLPAADRGAGGAMNQTFQNGAQVLSIGVFFTLMIIGLAATLPSSLAAGLEAHGVSAGTAEHVASLPPVSVLFATFLGYDPVRTALGPTVIGHLSVSQSAALTNHQFFPSLISKPFGSGLHTAFLFAIGACVLAALMSWSRGRPTSPATSAIAAASLVESVEPEAI